MRQKKKLLLGGVLVVIAILATLFFLTGGNETPPGTLRLYGNVDIRQVQLAFHSTGRIEKITVEEGERVAKGELLASLHPSRYEAAAQEARSRMLAQQEELDRLLEGSRAEEIQAARARVNAAEASAQEARTHYQRVRPLAKEYLVSRQQLDDAEARLKSARANLDAARQDLTLTLKGPRQQVIAAARALLEGNRAALRQAEEKLADTRLFAPVDGVIRDRLMEPGDMAFPQTPVFSLALTNPIWIRAYIEEPDLGKIAPGMRATVTTDSYPDKEYEGWIGYISPEAEFTPKQVQTTELRSKLVYQVRIYVCNPQNQLRLGMPVTVDLPLDQKSAAVDRQTPCGNSGDGGT